MPICACNAAIRWSITTACCRRNSDSVLLSFSASLRALLWEVMTSLLPASCMYPLGRIENWDSATEWRAKP